MRSCFLSQPGKGWFLRFRARRTRLLVTMPWSFMDGSAGGTGAGIGSFTIGKSSFEVDKMQQEAGKNCRNF